MRLRTTLLLSLLLIGLAAYVYLVEIPKVEEEDKKETLYSLKADEVTEIDLAYERFGNGKHIWLDLGKVCEIAEVELNGQNLGILWKPPARLDITAVAKPGKNQLTVRVTNFWPNRIIGDQIARDSAPVTQTNIRKLTASTPLMPSGLLGPVRLLTVIEQPIQFQPTEREVSQRSDNSATQ